MEGSAPKFVTEDDQQGDGDANDDDASADANDEAEEDVRVGLGSRRHAGIGGSKQQQQPQPHERQQARTLHPITSNAAFAASLFQVRGFRLCNFVFLMCHLLQRSKWGDAAAGSGLPSEDKPGQGSDAEVEGMPRDAFDELPEQRRFGLGGSKRQPHPTAVDPEVAKNLKNLLPGNNKIFKMLEKMGFKNRLGKNEDGLATALAPTMLEAGSGLGYNQKNLQSAKEAKKKNEAARAGTADGPIRRQDSTGWMKVCGCCSAR